MLYIWELHSCSVPLYYHICVHIVYVSYIWYIYIVYHVCLTFSNPLICYGYLSCFHHWLLWTLLHKQRSKYLFSVLLDVYLVEEFLGHMLTTYDFEACFFCVLILFSTTLLTLLALIDFLFCFCRFFRISSVKMDSFPYSFSSWMSLFLCLA